MHWILWALVMLGLTVAAAGVWIRARPVPEAAFARPDVSVDAGLRRLTGGVVVVARPDDPDAAMARLLEVVKATDRTEMELQESDRFIAVTRSRVFGFPDVAHAWIDGDRLIVHSHLVIGKSDTGVNADRVEGWLNQADIAIP